MLVVTLRDVLPKARAIGQRVVDQLDDIIGQFTGLWDVEHNEDGTHADITTGTIDATDRITVHGETEAVSQARVDDTIVELEAQEDLASLVAIPDVSTGDEVRFDAEYIGPDTFINADEYPNLEITADVTKLPWQSVGDLIPDADGTRYLGYLLDGVLTRRWRSLYFSKVVYGPKVVATTSFYERNRTVGVGEWTSYTPVWTGAGGNPTLGNGSLTGKYSRVGTTVHFKIRLIIGSTTTLATGLWMFTMPFTKEFANREALGPCLMEDVGAADWTGTANNLDGTTLFVAVSGAAGLVYLTNTTPFAWGTDDFVSIQGTYEMA